MRGEAQMFPLNRAAIGVALLALAIAPLESALAQTRREQMERQLLPSYLTPGGGLNFSGSHLSLTELLYEADINQHIHIEFAIFKKKWFLKLNPRFRLRMLSVTSFPVRTPSFMPSLTAFLPFANYDDSVGRSGFNYVTVMYRHHSNGQDGEFYNPDGTINVNSGDFGTDFLEFGFNRIWPHGKWTRFSLRLHVNVTRDSTLDDHYERSGAQFTFGSIALPNVLGFSAELGGFVSYALSGRSFVMIPAPGSTIPVRSANFGDQTNLAVRLLFRKGTQSHLRGFAEFYYGFDYYNINFWRPLRRIQVGIAATPF